MVARGSATSWAEGSGLFSEDDFPRQRSVRHFVRLLVEVQLALLGFGDDDATPAGEERTLPMRVSQDGEVLAHVTVDDEDVGRLADLDAAGLVVEPEHPSRFEGRALERLERRQAHV